MDSIQRPTASYTPTIYAAGGPPDCESIALPDYFGAQPQRVERVERGLPAAAPRASNRVLQAVGGLVGAALAGSVPIIVDTANFGQAESTYLQGRVIAASVLGAASGAAAGVLMASRGRVPYKIAVGVGASATLVGMAASGTCFGSTVMFATFGAG
ncbi:MAG TPA: hypothetical protein VFH51_10300, partial [Myxococcota bacterium]|nr:hypothetical protein [Myxococcota bacterium]